MANNNGVLIVVETKEGKPTPASLELLAFGNALSQESKHPLYASPFGSADSSTSGGLATMVDKVYAVEDPSFDEFDLESRLQAITQVVQISSPAILLLGASLESKDLAPRLALRLDTGVVNNCEELRVDMETGVIEALCSVFGGAALSTYRFDDARPCIVNMSLGVAQPINLPRGDRGETISVSLEIVETPRRAKVVDRISSAGPRLEESEVIVAGGKGLGIPENFLYIQELADVLGGMSAASRAIVDLGWATPAQQVGLTGKVVTPNLYLAIGISGASQHMVGCSSARNIVAVNRDEDAPIFQHARYGVVADCLEFLPAFIVKCRQLGTV